MEAPYPNIAVQVHLINAHQFTLNAIQLSCSWKHSLCVLLRENNAFQATDLFRCSDLALLFLSKILRKTDMTQR